MIFCRIDTGDDRRVSKEEFTSEAIKPVIEKWVSGIEDWDAGTQKSHSALFPVGNEIPYFVLYQSICACLWREDIQKFSVSLSEHTGYH